MEDMKSQLGKQRLWHFYVGSVNIDRNLPPFRISHESLVSLALQKQPDKSGRNVTDFTDWLFSLYTKHPSNAWASRGKAGETAVERIRIDGPNILAEMTPKDWKLKFRGLGDSPDPAQDISSLRVDGKTLRGQPDLVFEHKKTGEILILELKVSNKPVPGDGWPNLRAQLWAYAQIDLFSDAPRIHLACQVWKTDPEERYTLSAPLYFNHSCEEWNKRNAELFHIYGGTIS